jgi:D-xylose transport system permease protein
VLSSLEKKLLSSVIALALIALVFGVLTNGVFFEARNLSNLLRQTAIVGMLGVGMTWVILLGSIDLSIGSMVALVGIVVAVCQSSLGWGESGFPGVLTTAAVAIGVGAVLGAFNGVWISGLGIHGFVITFGMMVIARGLAMIISKGQTISPMGPELNFLGAGYLGTVATAVILSVTSLVWMGSIVVAEARARRLKFPSPTIKIALKLFAIAALTVGGFVIFFNFSGLPVPVLFLAIIAFLGSWILNATRFGRYIFAVGGNAEAARLAGISVKTVTFTVFLVMGLLSGLAGLLLTARLNSATPNAGQLFELDAIAAVVIGGTSLKGGKGSVLGSIIGAFIIESLNNGMSLLNVDSFYQMPLKGGIVILAVVIDSLVERRRD